MQTKYMPYLWEVLSANLPPDTWRAAHNDEGWLASCSKVADNSSGKATYQHILSTAFLPTPPTTIPAAAADTLEPSIAHTNPPSTMMSVYEKTTLEKMKIDQLREICVRYNIKQGKLKANLVDNISTRSQTVHRQYEEVERLTKDVRGNFHQIPGPAHNFYRAYFNLVDLADRKWNAVADHHGNRIWKSKMTLSILRFAVLNAWTFATKIKYEKWRDWRCTLACSILEINMKQ